MKAFFDHVRQHVFGGALTPGQVEGMNSILMAWTKFGDGSIQNEAYVLATPCIETGWTMQPIHERGARPYFDKYEPGTKLGARLGNTAKGDGFLYRGRGLVQITGRANYRHAGKQLGLDLEGNPDLALNPETAARILVVGTLKGWFTGKGLNDYIDDVDESDDEDLKEFVQARRTVNGQDRAVEIGKIALQFEKALKLAAA